MVIEISAASTQKAASTHEYLPRYLPSHSFTSTTIEYANFGIGYGLSETTGGVIHQIEEEEHAWGCVGKVLPGMYVARSIFYLLSCLKTHC